MPRIQVYLPDDLHRALKARGLPASELLQEAVRAELRRLDLLDRTADHRGALVAEVGEPGRADRERTALVARRLDRGRRRP